MMFIIWVFDLGSDYRLIDSPFYSPYYISYNNLKATPDSWLLWIYYKLIYGLVYKPINGQFIDPSMNEIMLQTIVYNPGYKLDCSLDIKPFFNGDYILINRPDYKLVSCSDFRH